MRMICFYSVRTIKSKILVERLMVPVGRLVAFCCENSDKVEELATC